MKITIIVEVLLTIFLMVDAAGAIASEREPRAVPSYSGFADIQATKNRFLIAGDTQSTSHWEFWRERNQENES